MTFVLLLNQIYVTNRQRPNHIRYYKVVLNSNTPVRHPPSLIARAKRLGLGDSFLANQLEHLPVGKRGDFNQHRFQIGNL